MRGDYSRLSFDAAKQRNRVLLQQGRMLLDADWNEQMAILIHRFETLVRDLVGPCAAPIGAPGFEITEIAHTTNDFTISAGRLYVDGLCCENMVDTTYLRQPFPGLEDDLKAGSYLVYIDAWEQVVTPYDDPSLLDPALGGLDTALRTRLAWRVKVERLPERTGDDVWDREAIADHWPHLANAWQADRRHLPTMKVRVTEPSAELAGAPAALRHHYRGTENRLYRVEIHHPGRADENGGGGATIKWSRENGSVGFLLASLSETGATLAQPLTDPLILQAGDWVEISHPGAPQDTRPLLQIQAIGPDPQLVTFQAQVDPALQFAPGSHRNVSMRRWDQKTDAGTRGLELREGAVPVFPAGESRWIRLEDGVEVQFNDHERRLRAGDYWMFAARPGEGGGIEWPRDDQGEPLALPPHGVSHHYAPLALFTPSSCSTEYLYRPIFEPFLALVDRVAQLED